MSCGLLALLLFFLIITGDLDWALSLFLDWSTSCFSVVCFLTLLWSVDCFSTMFSAEGITASLLFSVTNFLESEDTDCSEEELVVWTDILKVSVISVIWKTSVLSVECSSSFWNASIFSVGVLLSPGRGLFSPGEVTLLFLTVGFGFKAGGGPLFDIVSLSTESVEVVKLWSWVSSVKVVISRDFLFTSCKIDKNF